MTKARGIAGESDDARHKGEIDFLAWSWGVSKAHEGPTGVGAGAGKPNLQKLAIKKLVDLASPLMLAATAKESHISDAVLTVHRAGTPQDFLVISGNIGKSEGNERRGSAVRTYNAELWSN